MSSSDELAPATDTSSAVFRPQLLESQVAIVTGGGTGIGRATALELARLGAEVVVVGRREEPLRETSALSEGRCHAMPCDIREESEVGRLVDAILNRFGRCDLLVNNAGGQYLAPAEEISPKGFRAVVRLNLEGTWLMTHAVATRAMIPGGRGGKVVAMTVVPHHGLPGMAHTSAARAGVENLMRVLSIEWARFGIRLNAIALGDFVTDAFAAKYPQSVVDAAAASTPLGRTGRPEEVAWMVAYLASPAGDFLTGTVLTLDGGRDDWEGQWPSAPFMDRQGQPVREARPS